MTLTHSGAKTPDIIGAVSRLELNEVIVCKVDSTKARVCFVPPRTVRVSRDVAYGLRATGPTC